MSDLPWFPTKDLVLVSRHIPLDGIYNCRDLGGIETEDGYKIKNGLLFRSSDLSKATLSDLDELNGLGVRNDIDFRTEWEIISAPDQILTGWSLDHLPILHERDIEETQKNTIRFAENFYREPKEVMIGLYPALLMDDQAIKMWKKFFKKLLTTDTGILYHCTEGKDRTGIASILIESVLGVDEKKILDDYLQTNLYAKKLIEQRIARDEKIPFVGKQLEKDNMYFLQAEPEYFTAAKKTVEPFGGFTGYLKEKIGLTDEDFETLRKKYLVDYNE